MDEQYILACIRKIQATLEHRILTLLWADVDGGSNKLLQLCSDTS